MVGVATTILMLEYTREKETVKVVEEPQVMTTKLAVVDTKPKVEEVEEVEEVKFDNEYDNMIYHATKDTVVDPILAIAISRLETGHYTSRAFVEGNNFGGITVESGVKSFDSLNEGLERYITLLEWYHDEGMNTAEKMQATYCPPFEDWDEEVNAVYEDFIYKNM